MEFDLLNPMQVLLISEKKVYMLRIGFINLIIISKIHPSYLKKKTFAKFGPSYRVHFDQTEKEKTNKQKFQKWS